MKAERSLIAAVSLLLLLLAAVASPTLAQTETFDLASFTPPAGWKVSQNQTAITYTAIDQATRTYCMFGVYTGTPSSGDAMRDFAGEWESIVRHGFVAGVAPTPAAGRIASGLTYLEGGANVKQQGAPSYAHLMVFSAGARNFSVLIVATDRAALGRRQATIQAFLDSIPYSAEDIYRCPLRVLRDRKAHCFDGAMFAAAALRRLGAVIGQISNRDKLDSSKDEN
jgi:hypothetical protein